MATEKMYTTDDLIKLFGVSKTTIYKEVRAGKLKAFKIGKNYRFQEHDVEVYMDTLITKPVIIHKAAVVQPEVRTFLISARHPGVIAWLKKQGITGEVKERVSKQDVIRRVVFGELPLTLVTAAKAFYRVELINASFHGLEDLTLAEMERIGVRLARYDVTRTVIEPADALKQAKQIQKSP